MKRFRSRLVAQGFRQTFGEDYEEIFSPVVNYVLIRLFFVLLVVLRGWQDCHLDVKCAYLYGELDCTTYLAIPKGWRSESNDGMVWKLQRALYGLHQSGRQWYIKLDETLKKLGFTKFRGFNCVYFYGDFCVIMIYVDDIVMFTPDLKCQEYCIAQLASCFDLVNLGKIQTLLGVNFLRENNRIFLSQATYIDALTVKYKEFVNFVTKVPGNIGQIVQSAKPGDLLDNIFPYRSLIGSLLFLATRTRPDILFSVILLSQYNTTHTKFHVRLLIQVLNYVVATRDYRIELTGCTGDNLIAYCDASFASDRDSRRSFGGFIVYLGNIPISWNCAKQKAVTLSTMEAEYITLVDCAKEVNWLNHVFLSCPIVLRKESVPLIFTDNVSCVHFTKNEVENSRTKHIDVKFKFLREWFHDGLFTLRTVGTKYNIADVFTKWLTENRLKFLIQSVFTN